MTVEVEVYAPEVVETSEAVIEKEMFWYDGFYARMVSLRGSCLKYEYVDEEYIELEDGTKIPKDEATPEQLRTHSVKKAKRIKAFPNKFTVKVDTRRQDLDAVRKWFHTYSSYNETGAERSSSDSNSVVFTVPQKELDDFAYNLERSGIRFRVL